MDPYVQPIRRALSGVRESRPAIPPNWQKGQTNNHEGAIATANYGLDPHGPWRGELLRWFDTMLNEKGLWCTRFDDEFGSSSHCAHQHAVKDPALYFAMLNGDDEMLERVMAVQRGEHAVESLCATPKGDIVITGARSHYGDPKSADQRQQRNKRWQWLMGRKIKMPAVLATADDWLGLYCLTLIAQQSGQDAFLRQVGWADQWRTRLKQQITTATDLPLLRNPISIERAPNGHTVRMLTAEGCIRPALWAIADYRTGEELYGCDPKWPKDYKGAKVGDVPVPTPAFATAGGNSKEVIVGRTAR